MNINFATCERHRALGFIKQVYPGVNFDDTPESAGMLLDLVGEDIVRIQDPMMYGSKIAVIPGTNFVSHLHLSRAVHASRHVAELGSGASA